MSKREKRLSRLLKKQEADLLKSQRLKKLVSPDVAKPQLLVFGFQHFEVSCGKFSIGIRHGEGMFNIFKEFVKHSGYEQNLLLSRKQFHRIEEDRLKRHNLAYLCHKYGEHKIFQLGSRLCRERIVGYFNSAKSFVFFEVCILDLYHRIYPDH